MKAALFLFLSIAAAAAQGFPAFIELADGNTMTASILDARPDGLNVSVAGGQGTMLLPAAQVKAWKLEPPKATGEIASRDYARRVVPLLNAAGGDAEKYFFAYTDLLRSARRYQEAIDFIALVPEKAPVPVRARSVVTRANCLVMLGRVDEAERLLNLLKAPARQSSLFMLYQLTRARLAAARHDLVGSLDDIAQVVAFKRLGSDGYAEALFLSADAYENLGAALAKQKEAIEKNEALSRLYQTDREAVYAQLGLLKSSPSAVSALIDTPPDFPAICVNIRKQLVRLFPASVWAVQAKEKLPAAVLAELSPGAVPAPPKTGAAAPKPTPAEEKLETNDTGSKTDNL